MFSCFGQRRLLKFDFGYSCVGKTATSVLVLVLFHCRFGQSDDNNIIMMTIYNYHAITQPYCYKCTIQTTNRTCLREQLLFELKESVELCIIVAGTS